MTTFVQRHPVFSTLYSVWDPDGSSVSISGGATTNFYVRSKAQLEPLQTTSSFQSGPLLSKDTRFSQLYIQSGTKTDRLYQFQEGQSPTSMLGAKLNLGTYRELQALKVDHFCPKTTCFLNLIFSPTSRLVTCISFRSLGTFFEIPACPLDPLAHFCPLFIKTLILINF